MEVATQTAELLAPSRSLRATFVPGAGMLGWSLRHEGEEVLGQPVPLERYVETAEPTGIPLLHPWANRLASPSYEIAGRRVTLDLNAPNVLIDPQTGLPIHGLAGASPHWEVVSASDTCLSARLDWSMWPELFDGFPFPHVLELDASLSDSQLEIAVSLRPTGDSAVPVAFGFHPYLRVPGLDRRDWWLELPVTSRMELDPRMLPTGRSEPVRFEPGPIGDRMFDDAFDGLADAPEFAVSGGGRRIWLRFLEGYRFAQVFTPPRHDSIAFEPMTAPINPFASPLTQLVQPGSRYSARFAVGVSS
jgi:galactose mutarotase-like enzyme